MSLPERSEGEPLSLAGARESSSSWQERGRAPLLGRTGESPSPCEEREPLSQKRSWSLQMHVLDTVGTWPSRVAVAVAPEMAGNCKRLRVYIHKGAVRTHLPHTHVRQPRIELVITEYECRHLGSKLIFVIGNCVELAPK